MAARGSSTTRGSTLEYLSAEHGNVELAPEARDLAIGDRLEFIPDYSDTTTFLHNNFIGLRDGRVEAVIPLVGPRQADLASGRWRTGPQLRLGPR